MRTPFVEDHGCVAVASVRGPHDNTRHWYYLGKDSVVGVGVVVIA